ncbi:MAG: hypothetical protein IKQ61_12055 [Spirochaetales bacterium]|nr:hypothetical protein [Spirochaetales bacterium]
MKKLIYIFISLCLILSCTKQEVHLDLSELVSESVADTDIYLRSISVHKVDDSLRIVYCDEQTQALKYAAFTESDCDISYIDKVDTSEKHNANMGVHGYECTGGTEYLVYEEYKSEKKMYFKAINRRAGKPSWTVDILGANPSEFLTFSYDDNLFIMYTDDRLLAKQYDSGLAAVRMTEDIRGIISPRLYKNEESDTLYLYCIENNMLAQRTMHISKPDKYQIDTIDATPIAENIKAYTVSLDDAGGRYMLCYNENALTLTLLDPNIAEPKLMGYYSTVYALESIIIDGQFYCVVSSIVPDEESPLTYQLTLIYRDKNDNWQEGSLITTAAPVYQMALAEYHGNMYIVYGINSLKIARVDMNF